MQPYFLPYIGYFQLIAQSDLFVVYDNIKYTKKGWINRNRFLLNGSDAMFSIPLRKASDSLDIVDREVSPEFDRDRLLNQLVGAYRKAPYFARTIELLEAIVRFPEPNLFRYLQHSLQAVCAHLGLRTELRVSSSVDADHRLRGQDRVIAVCAAVGAMRYLNPLGGVDLYDAEAFALRGIRLEFLQPQLAPYTQFDAPFVPGLSIADVMMFNSTESCQAMLASGHVVGPEALR